MDDSKSQTEERQVKPKEKLSKKLSFLHPFAWTCLFTIHAQKHTTCQFRVS